MQKFHMLDRTRLGGITHWSKDHVNAMNFKHHCEFQVMSYAKWSRDHVMLWISASAMYGFQAMSIELISYVYEIAQNIPLELRTTQISFDFSESSWLQQIQWYLSNDEGTWPISTKWVTAKVWKVEKACLLEKGCYGGKWSGMPTSHKEVLRVISGSRSHKSQTPNR